MANIRFEVRAEHVLAVFVIVFLLFAAQTLIRGGITGAIVLPPSGNLSCEFIELANASCPGGYTRIFGMSAQENAHVEAQNESNYNVSVCCRDLTGSNALGTGSDGTGVINLSNFTNAHAETPSSGNYLVPVYLNASNASIGCSVNLTGEGSCPADFACMGTLSNETNAHVSNCTGTGRYNVTVCCSIGALITVYLHPNTAPTDNLTANGSINGTLVNGTETSYETQDILYFNASDNDKRFLSILGQFNLSNVDARSLVIEYNQSAVAANLSGVTGAAANHTLFLANNSNNLGVHVCPNAESLADIVPGCTGEVNFTGPFPQSIPPITVSADGTDFRIENILGSGVELIFTLNTSVTNSNLSNSTAQDSVLVDSSMNDSSVSSSSSKVNVTMVNSTNINSTVSFAIEIDTILTTTNASNCRFEQTTVTGSSCLNSIMIAATGTGWEVDPSNVTNSSCSAPCNITDSNVSDSTLSNAVINNSNLTRSNATNSELHNSTVDMSNIVGLIVLDANITNQFCFYGTIIQGVNVFNCPIALSSIYSPPSSGQGGGGSSAGAGAAAGSAAAAAGAAAGAAASGAASAAKASVSVQAAAGLGTLPQCQTVIPKVTSERPEIPPDFVLLGKSDFTCFNNIADFTINVPDQYDDLRAIRCRRGVCAEVETTERAQQQLLCGEQTVREIRDEQIATVRANVSVEIPVTLETDRFFSDANRQTIIGPYELVFDGLLPPRFVGRVSIVQSGVPLPPNPRVVLLLPPVRVALDDVRQGIWFNVSVPSVRGIDVSTLTLATYQRGQWVLLGGEYDPQTDSVKVHIPDAGEFADDGEATFGLLGVVCEACTHAELVQDYTDGSSRRALILVHGLTANSLKFGTLIDDFRLNSQPWQVWTLRYPYNVSIEENARELSDLLTLHSEEFDEVYVLGHSLGGLIAQQALWDSYQRVREGGQVPWLGKVKRAIIVGTPNQGSPTADVYRALLSNLFNLSASASPFDVNSSIIQDLAFGRSIPPVPGIDYQVIVGTRAIPFTERLFGAAANDGVLTPESGSTLGDVAFRNACENYYAINITHVDLDDHPTAIRVVQRILNKELATSNPNLPLLGFNQYLRVHTSDCSPEDSYFIIGRPIPEEATFDPLLCECGNRYCNEGETPENCPSDCARISLLTQSCVGIVIAAYPIVLLTVLLVGWRYALWAVRKRRGGISKVLMWAAVAALVLVALVQPLACKGPNAVVIVAALGALCLAVLELFAERPRENVPRSVDEAMAALPPESKRLLRQKLGRHAPKEVPPAGEVPVQEKIVLLAKDEREVPKKKGRAPAEKQVAKGMSVVDALRNVAAAVRKGREKRKEQRRLAQIAKDASFGINLEKIDETIDALPDEVKRRLRRRKK